MGTLEIRLFGTFQMQRDGRPLLRSTNRRVRDLLCYLLLKRDTPQPREHLAGVFWGDRDDSRARHCLNTALWRLQSALATPENGANPYLTVDAQSLRVNGDSDIWIDVVEFQRRCAWAAELHGDDADRRASLYMQAIDLYRGDLLIDSYDDWCVVEREYLQLLLVQSLNWLLIYFRERGDRTRAIDIGRRIIAIDPLREEVQRNLIQLYLDTNQRSAALRQYRACEAALRRELSIQPMPETRALLREIMATSDVAQVEPTPQFTEWSIAPDNAKKPDLAIALERLREAGVAFDHARQQLAGAVNLVEDVLRKLDGDDSLIHEGPHTASRSNSRNELYRATTMIAGVVDELSGTAGGPRQMSAVPAIRD